MATCKGLFFYGWGVGVLALPKQAVCTFANRKRAQRLVSRQAQATISFRNNRQILISKTTFKIEQF